MTDLRRTLATSSVDHQISLAESLAIAKAAGGSEKKLSKALEAQGFRSWDADSLAKQILQQASVADGDPTVMSFPTPAPVKVDQRVAFVKSREARLDLVRSAPQQEPSSPGYMPVMSGGAVVAAALILDSETSKAAKQNAQAIITLARELGENPDLNKEDLERLAEGKMSPRNLQRLQNLLLAMGGRAKSERAQPGLTEGQLDALVAKLRAHGAFQQTTALTFRPQAVSHHRHPDRTLHGTQWTVDVGGIHVNPWANDGHDRSAIVEPTKG